MYIEKTRGPSTDPCGTPVESKMPGSDMVDKMIWWFSVAEAANRKILQDETSGFLLLTAVTSN